MRISGVTYVSRKTHTARNTVIAVVFLLLLLCIAAVILSTYEAWTLIHPEKTEAPPIRSGLAPEYRNVSFKDAGGSLSLKGWLFDADSSRAVILVHDSGMNRLQFGTQTLDLINGLHSNGYAVLAFDLRGSGLSAGNTCRFGSDERRDILGAVRYTAARGYKDIVLAGFGTGASACILAASDAGSGQDGSIEAVIADSPYADLKDYLNREIPEKIGLPAFPFSRTIRFAVQLLSGLDTSDAVPGESITGMASCPLLLIQGLDDSVTPAAAGRSLYNAYKEAGGGSAKLWEVRGAGHLEAYRQNRQEYLQTVYGFLSDSMHSGSMR